MPRPIVFSGPSGSGKTTLLNMLTNKYPNMFAYSIGYTTRTPRAGEVNGIHYNFVPKETFEEMIKNNEFLEWSCYCCNYYGQAKKGVQDLIDRGISPILAIDMNGVMSIKKMGGSALRPKFVFIQTPSLAVLDERLSARGTESEMLRLKRLEEAQRELEYAYSSPGVYDLILINDNIESSFEAFEKFALSA